MRRLQINIPRLQQEIHKIDRKTLPCKISGTFQRLQIREQ